MSTASITGHFERKERARKVPVIGSALTILDNIEITILKKELDTLNEAKRVGKKHLMKGQKKSPSHHRLAGLAKSF